MAALYWRTKVSGQPSSVVPGWKLLKLCRVFARESRCIRRANCHRLSSNSKLYRIKSRPTLKALERNLSRDLFSRRRGILSAQRSAARAYVKDTGESFASSIFEASHDLRIAMNLLAKFHSVPIGRLRVSVVSILQLGRSKSRLLAQQRRGRLSKIKAGQVLVVRNAQLSTTEQTANILVFGPSEGLVSPTLNMIEACSYAK